MSKVNLIQNKAELDKEAKLLATAIVKQDNRIQRYLLSEIKHIEEHRNPTRLNQFFTAIHGRGSRTHAMHSFIQAYANVLWKQKDGDKPARYEMKPMRPASEFDVLFDKALSDDWTKHKSEGKVVQFNLETRVEKLLVDAFKAGVSVEEIEAAMTKLKAAAQVSANEALVKAAKAAKAKKAKEKSGDVVDVKAITAKVKAAKAKATKQAEKA